MEDAKMYDLLFLFFGVWHMEDAMGFMKGIAEL